MEACAVLSKYVFPAILRGRPPAQTIRIWVPGCATGEEVYVIGIALLESLESAATPIQIFGTDVDKLAIAKARAGRYDHETLAGKLSSEQLRRFFVEGRDGFQVNKGLRDLCVFARHDLRVDPPFSRLDLICCRQLLGRLASAQRKALLPLFHFALSPTGLLQLDDAAPLDDEGQLFKLFDAQHKLYIRRPMTVRPSPVPHAPRSPLADPQALLDVAEQKVMRAYKLTQASNEALQSANEELESAQEELQSSNEELEEINEVLTQDNRELSRTSFELSNLLANMTTPVLMLDGELRIRQFNPVAEQVMKVRAADLGRPIRHLRLNLACESFESMLQQVKETGQGRDLEVRDTLGRWHMLRVRPCRTTDAASQGVLLMLVDIDQLRRSQQETEQTLDRTRDELRALTASLITAQEEERRRVSRELHDDLGQKVALIALLAARLEKSPTAAKELGPELAELRRQTTQLTEDLRRIAFQLHPAILDDLGLPFALKRLVEDFGRTEELPARFGCRGLPAQIPHAIASALYRIAQEALRNAAKHAGKTRVHVSLLGTADALFLKIRDHGSGFEPCDVRDRGGMGILSMEERAHLIGGRFKLKTDPGQGVSITVEVPLETTDARKRSPS